jgi:hypothetical protein
MKERKPKTIVMYIELEDNVGYILGKRRLEIPLSGDEIPEDTNDSDIAKRFSVFVDNLQKHLQDQSK